MTRIGLRTSYDLSVKNLHMVNDRTVIKLQYDDTKGEIAKMLGRVSKTICSHVTTANYPVCSPLTAEIVNPHCIWSQITQKVQSCLLVTVQSLEIAVVSAIVTLPSDRNPQGAKHYILPPQILAGHRQNSFVYHQWSLTF